ncbi:ribonuclease inhibitor isoform X5 [Ailuropoda melanoleuca]|uniref:ribonuclease inhibitor isoform X5 n=1 Tax=Ailuropoda melanoleuca TaxID=9646 RepID=UPI00149496F7|nr:ribonuclease inhibitor isoform X5 [Ailuropoda melanoleuca]
MIPCAYHLPYFSRPGLGLNYFCVFSIRHSGKHPINKLLCGLKEFITSVRYKQIPLKRVLFSFFSKMSFSPHRLIFCHLTASCGRDLSLVFETNQYLTDLEFVKNTLEDSGMKLLCEGLKQPNCILQTLRLYRCLLSPAPCGALAAVLSTSQWLTDLEFSETKLEASALKLLCEDLKDPNCKLQKLKLCASLLPESPEVVCKYLAAVLICNPNLTELDLSENPLGDTGVKYLCEGLRHSNCKVEKLELWNCHLTGECCQDLCNALYTNEYLRDLDLSDNALGNGGMQVLCEGLKHPSCKLHTLWLAECHLTDACCGALASVLNRNENLTLLDLSGNDLKDFGVQMLCDSLIQPICKLQTFYIDTDHLHEETFRKNGSFKNEQAWNHLVVSKESPRISCI